jgi:hypothetical protein
MGQCPFPINRHYRKRSGRSMASGVGFLFPDNRNTTVYRLEDKNYLVAGAEFRRATTTLVENQSVKTTMVVS